MKRTYRCMCFVLAMSILFAFPVNAANSRAMDASKFFIYTNAYLSKTGGNSFNINFEVVGTDAMEEIGVSYIELQTSTDDSNWSPIRYYYKSSYSNMIDRNTGAHSGYFTYTGVQNNYYRAYVEFYAKDDSGQGSFTTYTTSIKVP